MRLQDCPAGIPPGCLVKAWIALPCRHCWVCLLEISTERVDLFRWTDRHLYVLLVGLAAFQFLLCKSFFLTCSLVFSLLYKICHFPQLPFPLAAGWDAGARQEFCKACSYSCTGELLQHLMVTVDHWVAFAVTLLSWSGVLWPVSGDCACGTAWIVPVAALLQPQGWLCSIRVTPRAPSWPEVSLILQRSGFCCRAQEQHRAPFTGPCILKKWCMSSFPFPSCLFGRHLLALTTCLQLWGSEIFKGFLIPNINMSLF